MRPQLSAAYFKLIRISRESGQSLEAGMARLRQTFKDRSLIAVQVAELRERTEAIRLAALTEETSESLTNVAELAMNIDKNKTYIMKCPTVFEEKTNARCLNLVEELEKSREMTRKLQLENARLAEQIEQKNKVISSSVKMLYKDQHENSGLVTELAEKKKEIVRLKQEVTENTREVSSLSEQVQVKNEVISNVMKKLEKENHENTVLSGKLDDRDREVSRLRQDLNLKEVEVLDLKEELASLAEVISRLEERAFVLKNRIQSASSAHEVFDLLDIFEEDQPNVFE
jgi:chromosome segregation ATPase